MTVEVSRPPSGWECVERLKEDRDNPGTPYREVFVRKVRVSGEERAEEDLYLWKQEHGSGDEKQIIFETEDVLSGKDSAIIVFMPLYLIVKCVRDCFIMITSISVDLKHGRIRCVLKDIGGFVWDKVRDPFFAVAVVACAFFGLFSPFEGRRQVARIERQWHHVEDLRDPSSRVHYKDVKYTILETEISDKLDLCKSDKDGNIVFCKDSQEGKQYLSTRDHEGVPAIVSRHYYFLIAYCFQPHGRSDDSRYQFRPIKC